MYNLLLLSAARPRTVGVSFTLCLFLRSLNDLSTVVVPTGITRKNLDIVEMLGKIALCALLSNITNTASCKVNRTLLSFLKSNCSQPLRMLRSSMAGCRSNPQVVLYDCLYEGKNLCTEGSRIPANVTVEASFPKKT